MRTRMTKGIVTPLLHHSRFVLLSSFVIHASAFDKHAAPDGAHRVICWENYKYDAPTALTV
jgi:hypothetical protein